MKRTVPQDRQALLDTPQGHGLSQEEATQLRLRYGDNAIAERQLGGEIVVAHVVVPGSRSDRDLVERKLADLIDRQSAGAEVPIAASEQEVAAARELIAMEFIEVVVLSLGGRGALLVTAQVEERFSTLEVPVASAVGAGDSMLAAIALAYVEGRSLRAAVRRGRAAGAAAVMTPGTKLARRVDFERLLLAMEGDDGE